MLEIVENFMRASTPAAHTREAFLHGALSRIAPIYARLSPKLCDTLPVAMWLLAT
jgi:hypothetical protein